MLTQHILELFCDELTASVTLDALDRKGKLMEKPVFHEMSRVDCTA
jgi:hypothetical protein